ncbi:fluoride efflux transporter CrcB [Hyphomonas sp. WL0036]|uniref:fluoride efflux transporter CrcB n=1 Tax=Hyphomonas sediminis TaxID=2866160 RepID=UPI001C801C56|nr:fluoride efflux transporter CrcB [Hyphomonas sediminis]MBY9068279.1 fluoride efflux transporter CrcB [Hyphomonas sediminis]
MNGFLLVALGGAIGASLRHGVGLLAVRHMATGWPWSTSIVNVTGSLAMGLLAGWLALKAEGISQDMRLFLATGLLGGFTTFSAFSLEVATMLRSGETAKAALYAGLSLLLGVSALFIGLWMARRIFA